MKELLLSKGFVYNDYDYTDGNYYEYVGINNTEDTKRIASIFGFIDTGRDEDLLICCDEDFTEFAACRYDQELHYKKKEFIELVKKM